MEASKEAFLREFGEHYGYPNGPKTIDEIRATEFKRLDGLPLFNSLLYSIPLLSVCFLRNLS